MCQGEAWHYLEKLAEKTLHWEITRNESLGVRINIQNGGVHAVEDTTYNDTRFAVLENMLKGFVMSQAPTNFPPPQMVSCSQHQSINNSLRACPYFLNSWLQAKSMVK